MFNRSIAASYSNRQTFHVLNQSDIVQSLNNSLTLTTHTIQLKNLVKEISSNAKNRKRN